MLFQFKLTDFLKLIIFCVNMLNCNLFLWSKLNFQHHYSSLPEIILICWFAAQETFLIIINVENSCAAQYFCGKIYNQIGPVLVSISQYYYYCIFQQQQQKCSLCEQKTSLKIF